MTFAGRLSQPEPLSAEHVIDQFDCGKPEMNIWLQRHALQSQASHGSRTKVVFEQGRVVVGFYSLAAGSVARTEAPARVAKGLAHHPIPVVVLTRLAVDGTIHGKGLGTALLKDAILKVLEIADVLGVRALFVHSKDDQAKDWYRRRAEFEESPFDDRQLFLLLKDMRACLDGL